MPPSQSVDTLEWSRARPADFLALTKPRIVAMVMLTVAAGFLMAAPAGWSWLLLVRALLGTALVAAAANTLNQVTERDSDALMRRTRRRPLPAGRLTPAAATTFAAITGTVGIAYLAVGVNAVTAAIAAATLVSYAFLYTPLKRKTSLSTLVGAVPGALPILGGWSAAGSPLGLEAWALFWILFLWQLPHFLALAWIYRGDYADAGLVMLSVGDVDGRSTFRQATLYAVALLPVSLVPAIAGGAGQVYFFGAMALTLWLVVRSASAARAAALTSGQDTGLLGARARQLFRASVIYLPVLLLLMVGSRAL